jgi:putative nucleotidyltransferase with HDIG domain
MNATAKLPRRIKLRTVLLFILLFSGLIPLGTSAWLLIDQSKEVLRQAEYDNLLQRANSLAQVVNTHLTGVMAQMSQTGRAVLLAPGPAGAEARLHDPWVGEQLQGLVGGSSAVKSVRLLDANGVGLAVGLKVDAAAQAAMDDAFAAARKSGAAASRVLPRTASAKPRAVLSLPISTVPGGEQLYLSALLELETLADLLQEEKSSEVGVCLIDGKRNILWSDGRDPGLDRALLASTLPGDFAAQPLVSTQIYKAKTAKGERDILAQVSPVRATGWGLVVQKPLSVAFPAVRQMAVKAFLSTGILVVLALFFAYLAALRISGPVQRLTETTHAVAQGNFSGRLEPSGLTLELAELAEDFNKMSGHVERYVQQLRQAASANRDLFIGSLRAFAAAIDAKDPYTRGHSERVASLSRTIARHLQLPEETQHKVWIGALLHDVGKIGVEDRILRKEGVLAPEEYEQMKMHTVIGAEIMAPIEQLKEMVPAIRSHHEAWNGRGYPDGIKGEQINLMARIVAVADTFDAITTNRPYQQAYSLQFAVETITRLAGSRFDAKIVTAFLRAYDAGEIRAAPTRPSRLESTLVEARAAGSR